MGIQMIRLVILSGLVGAFAVGCTDGGLVEGGDVCNADTPGFGQPCGTCEVLRCAADGTLSCQAPDEPRQDLRLSLPVELVRLGVSDAQPTIRSALSGERQALLDVGDEFSGCLPGLTEPTTVELTVEWRDGDAPIATAQGEVEVTPGAIARAEALALTLTDADDDGAVDALETDTRGDAARPTDFLDALVDLWSAPFSRLPQDGVLIDTARMLVIDTAINDDGEQLDPEIATFDANWRHTIARIPLHCFPDLMAANLERRQVAILCTTPAPQVVLMDIDVVGGLTLLGSAPLPVDFVPLDIAVAQLDGTVWVAGRTGERGQAYPIAADTLLPGEPLAYDAPADRVAVEADRLAVAAGARVHAYDLGEGAPQLLDTADLPARADSVALRRGEIWVAPKGLAELQVFPVDGDGFGPRATCTLPAPALDIATDPGRGHWIFASTGGHLIRVLGATRAVEWVRPINGQVAGFADSRGLRASAGGVLARVTTSGWGLLGQRSDAVIDEVDDAPITLAQVPQRAVGVVSNAEAQGAATGLQMDRIEDLVELPAAAESLLLYRSVGWWVRTLLVRLEDGAPTQTLYSWSDTRGHNAPQALHLTADRPHQAGVSAFDVDAASPTGYTLDRLPLADAAAVAEAEPNGALDAATPIVRLPTVVRGELDPGDATPVAVTVGSGAMDGLEDLYMLDGVRAGAVHLVFPGDADLDLYLLDAAGAVLARATNTNPGAAETLVIPAQDEPVFVGVTQFDGLEGGPVEYTLYLAPL